MTEAEFVEAITSFMYIAATQTTQGLGLLFACVILEYLVGPKLSRNQVFVVSSRYLSTYVSASFAAMGAIPFDDVKPKLWQHA